MRVRVRVGVLYFKFFYYTFFFFLLRTQVGVMNGRLCVPLSVELLLLFKPRKQKIDGTLPGDVLFSRAVIY